MKNEIVYDKLVRDLIPDIIESDGKNCKTHIAKDEEYKQRLISKLYEETIEFIAHPCEEEMADILEVLDALIDYYDFSRQNLYDIKNNKNALRGKFEKRIVLEKVFED
ncbi:nucleoside triphosphate pyrophosphohydrolase [Clostridiaceae bacterium M8S5]|nr:nucleoside triphosphate pyrophosphohydrolase [Clostridiaceae bacterium M8S5]